MFKKLTLFIIITIVVVSLIACSSNPVSSTNTVTKIKSSESFNAIKTIPITNIDTKIVESTKQLVKNDFRYDSLNDKPLILGSVKYVAGIQNIAKTLGNQSALYAIMIDVDQNGNQLDSDDTNISRLHKLISSLIFNIGYVDMQTNYFRNKLNRVPKTLNDLIRSNKLLPVNKRWILLSVADSGYHMQGVNGEYNLKFLSYDSYYEAVYNKKGVLLNENNDPINMGTYNYGKGYSIKEHIKFDQDPYLIWGNSANSLQKGKDAINKGVYLGVINYKKNAKSVYLYRENLFGMQQGRVS